MHNERVVCKSGEPGTGLVSTFSIYEKRNFTLQKNENILDVLTLRGLWIVRIYRMSLLVLDLVLDIQSGNKTIGSLTLR